MIVVKLDELMTSKHWNNDTIIKLTNLSKTTVSKIKNKKVTRIDFNSINEICRIFDCKIQDFLEYIPD